MPAPADLAQARPRLTLQTLGRGDGLLGLMAFGPSGPRGPDVTVAHLDWLGTPTAAGLSAALQTLQALGLHAIPGDAWQWRSDEVASHHAGAWTLAQEEHFGDFWADEVPRLAALGWSIVVRPGFAHHSVPVQAWRLVVSTDTGEVLGQEVAGPLAPRPVPAAGLGLARREGSWLLTLGVEVDGESLDLAPMLADLLRRDAAWLNADQLAEIDDGKIISLRAPGGRRIETPAAPLKAIVAAMLDLLTDPRRKDGPFQLAAWDSFRLEALRQGLQESRAALAARAGPQGAWQLQGDDGLRVLARRLAGSVPQLVAAPEGLGITLRPYQLEGLAWLQYLRAQGLAGILADDMGLGKTAQTLAHLLLEKQAGRLDLPALVVVPTSLLFNWQAEARRMAPGLRVLTLHGPDRADRFDAMGQADVVLTTFALLWRDIRPLAAQPFHLLVLDEAQSVKNAAGRAARSVRRIRARHRLCLTGTPLENHLGELWAQFDFLMPGFLGDVRSFQRHWRKPIEVGGETLRAQALARRVRPFILRRRKEDVAKELPPLTEQVQRVVLAGQQRVLYESVRVAADHMVRRVLARAGLARSQISVLGALLRLRQVCCDPYLVKGARMPAHMERAKLDWLCDTLPALVDEGRRVLVFSQFTEMLGLIGPALARLGVPHLSLTGQTPAAQRGDTVARFQAREVPILLASLKAGGLGLNLTAADTVVHVDPWWNPAAEQQATARAHRIGQTQPVFVYKLVVEGSIEERMLELQARKSALAQGVLGEDRLGTVKFSVADLQDLLAPLGDHTEI
ncbi:helicase [Rhodoferax koreense]|uniref:Helicase n=1 Tax=Rhodoferax koreensis TaxID=1842727 RepID=A0A1P8K3H1_9BURK|nr:helicase [Rhodoferax koreense]